MNINANTPSSLPTSQAVKERFLKTGNLGEGAERQVIGEGDSSAIQDRLELNFNRVIEMDNSDQDRNPAKGVLDLSPEASNDDKVVVRYTGDPTSGSVAIEQSNSEFQTNTYAQYTTESIRQIMTTEPHDKAKYDPDLAVSAYHLDKTEPAEGEEPAESYQEYQVYYQS